MSDGREEVVSNPPDLLAVRADDALLDALGGSDPKVADELGQAELNELLLTWSREVDSEPMPQLVDTDTAIATIRAAKADLPGKRERRRRLYVPVAAAAAVLAVAFGGASIAARDAQPGDTLWGLTKVLYADKAASVEASYDVRAGFKIAENAMDDGELDTARDALDKARNSLDDVDDEEGHDGLKQHHDELRDQLEGDGDPGSDNEDTPSSGNQSPDASSPSSSEPTDSSSQTSTPPDDSSTSGPPPTSDPPASSTNGETTSEDGSRTSEGESDGAGANGISGADDGGVPADELAPAP